MPESFEKEINLNTSENPKSKQIQKKFKITFTYEDDNNFKIKAIADDGDEHFFFHFKQSDYVNKEEKDFVEKIKSFKQLLQTIKTAIEKKRLILWRDHETLKITLYYTIIYEIKKISFELHQELTPEMEKELIGEFYKDSEKILETKNNTDYRAEIVKYDKQFIDYGDRDIIKVTIENKGTCTWPRFDSSLVCVPEFSTLLCEEYVFDDEEVLPGEQVDVQLEFLKDEEGNLEPPFFTCLHLHIHPQNFDPMLVLDFSDAFKEEKIMASEEEIDKFNQTKITKIQTRIENKNTVRKTIITTRVKKVNNPNNNNKDSMFAKGSRVLFNANQPNKPKNNNNNMQMNNMNNMQMNNMNNMNTMQMNNMNNMNTMQMNNMNNMNTMQMNNMNNMNNTQMGNNMGMYNNNTQMGNNMGMYNNNMQMSYNNNNSYNNMQMNNNNNMGWNNNMQMNNNNMQMNNNNMQMNNNMNMGKK